MEFFDNEADVSDGSDESGPGSDASGDEGGVKRSKKKDLKKKKSVISDDEEEEEEEGKESILLDCHSLCLQAWTSHQSTEITLMTKITLINPLPHNHNFS